jgi:hypothetical protein
MYRVANPYMDAGYTGLGEWNDLPESGYKEGESDFFNSDKVGFVIEWDGPNMHSTMSGTYNGHQYAMLESFTNDISWYDAKEWCEANGGYLATITSSGENLFVEGLVYYGDRDYYWLGSTCNDLRDWRWITGESWSYTNWDTGEPSNTTGYEDYLMMRRHSGFWADLNYAYGSLMGFVCEWGAPEIITPKITVGVTANAEWGTRTITTALTSAGFSWSDKQGYSILNSYQSDNNPTEGFAVAGKTVNYAAELVTLHMTGLPNNLRSFTVRLSGAEFLYAKNVSGSKGWTNIASNIQTYPDISSEYTKTYFIGGRFDEYGRTTQMSGLGYEFTTGSVTSDKGLAYEMYINGNEMTIEMYDAEDTNNGTRTMDIPLAIYAEKPGSVSVSVRNAKDVRGNSVASVNTAELSIAKVVAPPVSTVPIDPAEYVFPSKEAGYAERDLKAIWITNNTGATLTNVTAEVTGDFTISAMNATTVANGAKSGVNVYTKTGLNIGKHTGELCVSSAGKLIATAKLEFTVTATSGASSLAITPASYAFASLTTGYTAATVKQASFQIKNTAAAAAAPVTYSISSAYFELVNAPSSTTIAGNGTANITVKPATALPVGKHTAELRVYVGGKQVATAALEFTVRAVSAKFVMSEDNYNFVNSRSSFGYASDYRIPLERYLALYSPSEAQIHYESDGAWGGSCYGFSASSVLANWGELPYLLETRYSYQYVKPGVPANAVTVLLETYQKGWWADNNRITSEIRGNRANFSGLVNAMTAANGRGLVITCYSDKAYHAVVGYDIAQVSSGVYDISIYDPNYPDDSARRMRVNTTARTFSYKGNDDWGSKPEHYFEYVSAGVIDTAMDNAINKYSGGKVSVNAATPDMVIRVPKGKTALLGGTPIQNIPGAYLASAPDSPGEDDQWIVPHGIYTFRLLDGSDVDVSVSSNGSYYGVKGADEIVISDEDGVGVELRGDTDKQFEIVTVLDDTATKVTITGKANDGFSVRTGDGGELTVTGDGTFTVNKQGVNQSYTVREGESVAIDTKAVAPTGITVIVDGKKVVFTEQEPVNVEGRVLVPVRAAAEAMNLVVDWNDPTKTVTIHGSGGLNVNMTIGNPVITITVNGTPQQAAIDVPPMIMNGRTMLPLRALSEALGANVEWEDATKTVTITNR